MEEQKVQRLAKKLTGEGKAEQLRSKWTHSLNSMNAELTQTQVDDMVTKIAGNIRPFALDVRRGVYDDGLMYLGVVNTVGPMAIPAA